MNETNCRIARGIYKLAVAAVVLVLGLLGTIRADLLTLKDGTVLSGAFLGSDGKTIQFQGNIGTVTVEKEKVASISFTTPGVAAAAATPAATQPVAAPTVAQPAAEPEPKKVTLPSGTLLLVRMMSSVSSKNQPGAPITSTLLYDLRSEDMLVAKAGTRIIGRVQSASEPRGLRGRTTLDVRLTEMLIGSDKVRIATTQYKEAGEAGIKQAAKGAAVGAAIGGIADGGDGAAKGAAVGAGVGVLKKGKTITISPGALLEFRLTQPVTVTVKESK